MKRNDRVVDLLGRDEREAPRQRFKGGRLRGDSRSCRSDGSRPVSSVTQRSANATFEWLCAPCSPRDSASDDVSGVTYDSRRRVDGRVRGTSALSGTSVWWTPSARVSESLSFRYASTLAVPVNVILTQRRDENVSRCHIDVHALETRDLHDEPPLRRVNVGVVGRLTDVAESKRAVHQRTAGRRSRGPSWSTCPWCRSRRRRGTIDVVEPQIQCRRDDDATALEVQNVTSVAAGCPDSSGRRRSLAEPRGHPET
jgi:hypothetical protein